MKCPKCKSDNFLTVDSRDYFNNRIKRRKKCVCGHLWNTLEYIENERSKKKKPIKRCQYIGCIKPTFGKGNCTKYCSTHKQAWDNLRWEIWRAKKENIPMAIPMQFNRNNKK